MSLLDEIKQSNSDPRRFIGRPASACRKCGGVRFYVSRFGAVVCGQCNPPRSPADASVWLVAQSGRWTDPDVTRDDSSSPAATPGVAVTKFERKQSKNTEYRMEAAWHAFADDFREWGWFEAAEFIGIFEHVAQFPELQPKGAK